MKKLLMMNAKTLMFWSLLLSIGYCFDGKMDVDIALVIIFIMQLL